MKEILSFLEDLQKNNNRDWFLANRKSYDLAKKQMLRIVSELIAGISRFDSDISGTVPGSAVFRINRDVRFSNNKDPYKNNMGAYFSRAGKKSPFAGYYFHIQPANSFIASGIWMPEAPVLNAIRREIHFNHDSLRKILSNKDLKSWGKLEGEQLKTSPKGYDSDHPALDLLRHKSFVFTHHFSDKQTNSGDFLNQCLEMYKSAMPFVKFINEAVESGIAEKA
jgi:uncharacterized protein (TIGR02453 family)